MKPRAPCPFWRSLFLLFAHVPQHALVQLLECGHQLLALGFSGIAPDIHLQPQFGAILHGQPPEPRAAERGDGSLGLRSARG